MIPVNEKEEIGKSLAQLNDSSSVIQETKRESKNGEEIAEPSSCCSCCDQFKGK